MHQHSGSRRTGTAHRAAPLAGTVPPTAPSSGFTGLSMGGGPDRVRAERQQDLTLMIDS